MFGQVIGTYPHLLLNLSWNACYWQNIRNLNFSIYFLNFLFNFQSCDVVWAVFFLKEFCDVAKVATIQKIV
jgi:hypothetical protein